MKRMHIDLKPFPRKPPLPYAVCVCCVAVWLCAGQVPEGLDLAVLKMKQGERALVTIAPQYAFGEQVRYCSIKAALHTTFLPPSAAGCSALA